MIDELNALLAQAKDELADARDEAQVEAARIKFLGKKGSLSAVLRGMGKLAPDERPRVGEAVNSVKAGIEDLLERAKKAVAERALDADLRREKLDVTLPGRPQKLGHRHPVSLAMDDIIEIFARLGFHVADGPEIEWDVYNFEKLCFPVDHPARDMQDTFSLDPATLPPPPKGAPEPPTRILRTHTSPV
ncbi:MAG: phenylalanine--tRNA ligase subunit alpha, partial [Deltaproteobacteria bacterium]